MHNQPNCLYVCAMFSGAQLPASAAATPPAGGKSASIRAGAIARAQDSPIRIQSPT